MLGHETRGPASPVSSMRSFWGLMRAYWLSESWREAWGLTFAILVLTALSAQASVWFAVTSGELINRIAYFHHPTTPTTPKALLTTAATLAAIAIMRDVCFTAVRHFFSTTLHRKWREWLDRRFNEALLDTNHTHFHLQQFGSDAAGSAIPAPDNVDQRVQESIKGMTGGAIGLAMGIAGVVLSLGFVGSSSLRCRAMSEGSRSWGAMAARAWLSRRSRFTCRSTPSLPRSSAGSSSACRCACNGRRAATAPN
jgi:ABC-type uncharacterized transport system fused permease/ATPase subunit